MKKVLLIMFILTSLLTLSCAAKPVYLTEKDNGREVTVKQGAIINVKLRSNPTTGYDWYIKEKPGNITEKSKTFIQSKTKKGILGVGGETVFTFKASSKGTGTLVLIYQRKWEEEALNSNKFVIKINVK